MQTTYFPASTKDKKNRKSPLPFEIHKYQGVRGHKQKSTMDPGPIQVAKNMGAQSTFYSGFTNQSDWQVIN